MVSSFTYHSEQVRSVVSNGRGKTRRHVVNVKNGKGTKAVEEYAANGQIAKRSEKPLSAKELECIRKCRFIPGLFQDCEKCLKPLKMSRSPKRKTRRQTY